jgi:hypothetical protein
MNNTVIKLTLQNHVISNVDNVKKYLTSMFGADADFVDRHIRNYIKTPTDCREIILLKSLVLKQLKFSQKITIQSVFSKYDIKFLGITKNEDAMYFDTISNPILVFYLIINDE